VPPAGLGYPRAPGMVRVAHRAPGRFRAVDGQVGQVR